MSKLFSKSLYIDALYRIRGVVIFSLVYFTFMSSSTPATFLMELLDRTGIIGGISQMDMSARDFMSTLVAFASFLVPIMTMVAFSFLYKRNTADFFEHLPYTRLSMSVSTLLAVLTAAVAVITVSCLFSTLLLIPSISAGLVRYDFLSGVSFAVAILIAAIYSMAATFVGVSVTGTFIGTASATIAIIVFPRWIMTVTTGLLETLSPTLVTGHSIPLFNNSYNLVTALSMYEYAVLSTPTAYIYTFILGALLLFLGLWLYHGRRSESATRMFASRRACEIIRISLSASIVLSAVVIAVEGIPVVSVFLVIVGFVAHLILGRSLGRERGSFKRTLVTFALGVGCAALIAGATYAGSAVANAYSPNVDEISYISIAREPASGQIYINYSDYVELLVSDIKIEDYEVRKIVAAALERGAPKKNYYSYKEIPVKVKSGIFPRYRNVYLTTEEAAILNSSYYELQAYKDAWLSVGEGAYNPYFYVGGAEMEKAKVNEILAKYKSEAAALGYEGFVTLFFGEWSDYTLCYSVNFGGRELVINLPIYEGLAETHALTEKYVNEIVKQQYDALIVRLDEAVSSNKIQYLNLDFYDVEEYYYAYIELGAHNSDSADIVNELKDYIAPSLSYDKDYSMFISIYTDDTYDLGVSCGFNVSDDADVAKIRAFFEKYGNKYGN